MAFIDNLLRPILRGGINWIGKSRLPQASGKIKIPGLNHPVEILRDRWGVPHIYAESPHDLFMAQGFVHAQERLFQMELNRRTGQGTLSELVGGIALDTDRAVRTFGFNRLGKVDWSGASETMHDAILAYCAGVNALIHMPGVKLPLEFSLLQVKPAAWQPEDVTAFARVMMWQLSHAWHSEIIRMQLQEAVGAEHAGELEIHYPPQSPVTLPKGIDFSRLGADGALIPEQGPFLTRGLGSNSWVVAGKKTQDGHTYLFNDMHLALSIPGLWYQVHLNGGGYQVTGVSLPGAPGVLVGHNAHLAWGMTLAFIDCEDLYLEQFDPQDPTRVRYKDEWVQADVVEESIPIKGRNTPHVEKVIVTRHGPIISGVVGDPANRLAVRSMALRPSPSLDGWLDLNRASNWDEFVLAMRKIEAPQLSVSYADVEGNIGYWMTGRAPIRGKGDGRYPAPGWEADYEWSGEVPFEQMPHALNPEKGYLVHTNNKIVPDDYPYYLGNVWMNGSRARRIGEVLESQPKLSKERLCQLHVDYTSLPARDFVRRLLTSQSRDGDVRQLLDLLKNWDGDLSPQSVAGCIYEVARLSLARVIFEPALGKDLTEQYLGKAFNPVLMVLHEFFGHDITVLIRLLDQPNSWWIEQAGGREAVLVKSLKETSTWLKRNLGENPLGWQWGKIHGAVFPHPLGMQKPLDLVFNRGPFPIGGDADTPCQTSYLPHQPFHNRAWSPSFRQVVDLNDLSASLVIVPPGQSGHSSSPHYDDLIQPWLEGDYHPQLWTRHQVEANLEAKLILE